MEVLELQAEDNWEDHIDAIKLHSGFCKTKKIVGSSRISGRYMTGEVFATSQTWKYNVLKKS